MAERRNRAIMEMADCMLHSRNMKLPFWEEAVVFVALIRNPTPTRAFYGMTPYERLHGQKPYILHLRSFESGARVLSLIHI